MSLFPQSYPIHCLQKFTDAEDLYLHHRNIYDGIMRKRIADFPLDFGSILDLVLVGLHRKIGLAFNLYFTDYFPALYFQSQHNSVDSDYAMLLTEFLTDPDRAGEYAIDGPKCALVARFLLDCFIPPCSERNIIR